MFCKYCGNKLDQGNNLCKKCGCLTEPEPLPTQPQEIVNSDLVTDNKRSKLLILAVIGVAVGFVLLVVFVFLIAASSTPSKNNSYITTSSYTTDNSIAEFNVDSYSSNSEYGDEHSVKGWIEPDTWYVANDYQEVEIKNAQIMENGVILENNSSFGVAFYPVCKNCNELGMLQVKSVAFGDIKIFDYYCDNCGSKTSVTIKIAAK